VEFRVIVVVFVTVSVLVTVVTLLKKSFPWVTATLPSTMVVLTTVSYSRRYVVLTV